MSYRICTKCVMDTSDPDITFGIDGICNYCTEYSIKERERIVSKLELPWLIHEMKKQKGYHCLLGLSGGVDSSLCLHLLCEQGVKPLCFTVDNGWNTPESDENILRMVETLKVPFYRYTINLDRFRELQDAFIQSETPNIEIPTDHILMATTYDMARKYGIKYIISGGNVATEGTMPPAWGYNAKDRKFLKGVYSKFYGKSLKGLPTISLVSYLICRFLRGMKIVNLLDYYEYNRNNAKQLLKEKYGWKDYGEKHEESKYTKWFQDEYLPQYGIDKRRAHYASLIHSKQMTRDEALQLLKGKKLGNKKPKSHREYPNNEWLWNLLSKLYAYIR